MTAAPGAAIALVIGTFVVAVLLRAGDSVPHARPNPRSLHARPVPCVGGLAIWAGALPALAAWVTTLAAPAAALLATAWLSVVVVSLVDDWRGTGAATRLAVHIAAALCAVEAIAIVSAATTPFEWPAQLAGAVLIAWSANLFNFMDGTDGLAGAMAAIGFGAYATAAALGSAPALPFLAIAAAMLPFLVVNAPPARIFMGDVGSVPLGFLAATFGVMGERSGHWPAWFPLLVFLPFALDATVTLLRRAWRRERVWEAHRSHYYQRLHQMGGGHVGALAAYVALMAGCAGTALGCVAFAPGAGWLALGLWSAVHGALFATIDYHWRKNKATR